MTVLDRVRIWPGASPRIWRPRLRPRWTSDVRDCGCGGLEATYQALRAREAVGLANKETLVAGGPPGYWNAGARVRAPS